MVLVPLAAASAVRSPSSGCETAFTKPVVAIWVLLVAGAAVGAVGTPVKAGESKGTRSSATAATNTWALQRRLHNDPVEDVCHRSDPSIAPAGLGSVAISWTGDRRAGHDHAPGYRRVDHIYPLLNRDGAPAKSRN